MATLALKRKDIGVAKRPPGKRGRQRKPAEKALSKEVKEVIPESAQYSQLLEFEKRLDAALVRKRIDVQDFIMRKPSKVKRILRLYLSNTHNYQGLAAGFADEAYQPEWTLRIEGRLLEDPRADQKSKRRFSSFVTKLFVDFDKAHFAGEDNTVEWHRNASQAVSDGFEITRRGSQPVRATILLEMESHPPRFKLAPVLAETLGFTTATRMDAVLQLWDYVKAHNLHDPHEREYFKCDPHMQKVFRVERMKFSDVPQALNHLLLPADPLVFYYEVCVDPLVPRKQQAYDIEIETDDLLRTNLNSFMLSSASQADLRTLDDKIHELTQELERARSKRDFMMGFSQDPDQFVAAWVASQTREHSAQVAATALPEAQRLSTHYSMPWAETAIQRYFSTRAAAIRVASQAAHQELPP